MQQVNLTVHRRARWKLEQLSEADRAAVLQAAESLRDLSPEQWPEDRVKVLDEAKGMYLLYVGPVWRAFVDRLPTGELEIGDIVRQGLLDEWWKSSRKNGAKA